MAIVNTLKIYEMLKQKLDEGNLQRLLQKQLKSLLKNIGAIKKNFGNKEDLANLRAD